MPPSRERKAIGCAADDSTVSPVAADSVDSSVFVVAPGAAVSRLIEIADKQTATLEAIHVGKDLLRLKGNSDQQSDWCQGIPFLSVHLVDGTGLLVVCRVIDPIPHARKSMRRIHLS